MAFDKDELLMVAQALRERGWIGPNQTIPHGDVTKYKGEDHMLEGLRSILDALVEAKVEDSDEPMQPLETDQAQKLFVKAIQKIGIAGNFTVTDNGLKDLHMIGSSVVHKMKVSPVTFRVTLEDLTEHRLADLINLLRAAPSDLLE